MFGSGLFAFELVTALLIVAVVGAIAVGRGRQGSSKPKKAVRSPRDYFAGPPPSRARNRTLGTEGAE